MTDPDRAAIERITRNLRGVIRGADPEVVATEIVALMRGIGWRPTEARPLPAWQRPAGTGKPPTDGYLQARARLEEHLAERDREAS